MSVSKLIKLLGAGVALALAACGGGGGGGGSAPPVAPPATSPVSTDLQAKTLAARSANAMFAYDNMNSEAIVAALGQLPIGAGFGSGTTTLACAAGSATVVFNDADASGTVSAGDVATMVASACQPGNGFPWAFGGNVRVGVVGGNNVEQHLYFVAAGSAHLSATHAGTALGGNRTATGTYSLSVSNSVNGGPTDQTLSMPDLSIAHPNVNLRMTGLSFTVLALSSVAAAAGTFETSVAGVGNVQLALSVKNPLTVDASTTRFRPSAGTLTLTATDYSLDVQYGTGGTVTIRVDNGRDGSVDRTVSTTEAELDSLLTTP